jgi:hypothetical protein
MPVSRRDARAAVAAGFLEGDGALSLAEARRAAAMQVGPGRSGGVGVPGRDDRHCPVRT